MAFRFTYEALDVHEEKFGLCLQTPIDAMADRVHLQELYNRASEDWPVLFDELHQSEGQVQFTKTVRIPGKGQFKAATFSTTPRGIGFDFPHRQPLHQDEIPWPSTLNANVLAFLDVFTHCFPTQRIVSVGKMRMLVFQYGPENPTEWLRERFAAGCPAGLKSVQIKWNQGDERYVRLVDVSAVSQLGAAPSPTGFGFRRSPTGKWGIQVVLDVRSMHVPKGIKTEEIGIILDHADAVFATDLLPALNGE